MLTHGQRDVVRMNVSELALLVGAIGVGCICGKALGVWFGVPGWIGGFLSGCALVGAAYYGLLRLIERWHLWRPLRPVCRAGQCSSDDYELLDVSPGRAVFRCRCGTKYVRTGGRFGELADDGSVRPYMRRRGVLHAWEEDSGDG